MDIKRIFIYFLLCLGCFTVSFNIAAVTVIIPVLAKEFALSNFLAAKVITYYLIPYGIGALMYAPLTKFVSYRHTLIAAILVFGASSAACALVESFDLLLVCRVLMGISGACFIPLGMMIIGELFHKTIRGRLVGIFFSMAFIASIVGLLVSGYYPWRWVFYMPAFLAFFAILLMLLFPTGMLNHRHVGEINYLTVLKNKKVWRVFTFIFCISFLYHAVHKWYGVYLSEVYAMDQKSISFLITVTVVAGMIGQIFGGFLSDKKGRLFSCYVGIFGLALFVMLLAGKYHQLILTVLMVSIALSWTIGHNGISTIVTDFSSENRPIVASLNSSVRFISGGLGFYVSGFFVEKSFAFTYLGIGVLFFILMLCIPKLILTGGNDE